MVVQRCCVLGGVRCGRKGREQVVGVRRRSVQNSIDQSRRQLMNVLHPRAHQFVLVVVAVVVVAVIVVVLVVVVAAVLAAVLLRYCVQKVILWLQHKRVPCIVRSDVVLLFLLLARFFFHRHRRRAMCVAAVVGVNDVGVDKVVQVHQQQGVFVLF